MSVPEMQWYVAEMFKQPTNKRMIPTNQHGVIISLDPTKEFWGAVCNDNNNNDDDDDDDNNINNNDNSNNNTTTTTTTDNNNRIERRNSKFLQSPHCVANCLKWPGRNCLQIKCNTVQPAVCHLVQRDSSAIKFH